MTTEELLTVSEYKELLINKIYKILPLREEVKDWERYLDGLLVEINGAQRMFGSKVRLFELKCKLNGLYEIAPTDFALFRKTIFDSIAIVESL